jgi:integrase
VKIKLTDKAISSLDIRDREYRVGFLGWEGLVLRVYPSGIKSYSISYTTADGLRKMMALGTTKKVSVKSVKKMYSKNMGIVAEGGDPVAIRQAANEIPFLRDWVDDYIESIKPHRRSVEDDEGYLEDLLAFTGNKRINQISRQQIIKCFREVAGRGHVTANRWKTAVCSCFNAAVDMEHISKNPAAKIKEFPEEARARVFSDDEMARLEEAIKVEDPWTRAAFIVMIETGCRVGEILKATWGQFDLEGGWWTIPAGVAKSKKAATIPISPRTKETLLALCPGKPDDAVIRPLRRSKNNTGHRNTLNTKWAGIKKRAGLDWDLRVHDIRRTFGLRIALESGIHIASKLLRHSSIKITEQVYAPFGVEEKSRAALREAVMNQWNANREV